IVTLNHVGKPDDREWDNRMAREILRPFTTWPGADAHRGDELPRSPPANRIGRRNRVRIERFEITHRPAGRAAWPRCLVRACWPPCSSTSSPSPDASLQATLAGRIRRVAHRLYPANHRIFFQI